MTVCSRSTVSLWGFLEGRCNAIFVHQKYLAEYTGHIFPPIIQQIFLLLECLVKNYLLISHINYLNPTTPSLCVLHRHGSAQLASSSSR